MTKRLVILAMAALVSVSNVVFGEEGPRVMARAHLEPAGTIVVGQPVKLIVEVLVTTWFTGAPEYPPLDIPGALVTVPDEQSAHLTEQIDGTTWFGLTRTYRITPMEPKKFTVPRLPILLHPGLAPKPVTVWSPSRTFSVRVPAGAEGAAVFLATSHLEMTQRFDRMPDGLKVGDAFTRTITITAKDTQAMFLPPIAFVPVDGLTVYPNAAQVDNISKDRQGFIGGRRVDSATYVAQKPGHYELPEIVVQWWDLSRGKLQERRLPPVTFDAAPHPGARSEFAIPAEEHDTQSVESRINRKVWAKAAGTILMGMIAGWLLRRKIRNLWQELSIHRIERRRRYEMSEAAVFARLRDAADRGDEADTIRLLYQWLDRCRGIGKPALVEHSVTMAQDEEFKKASERLLAGRFAITGAASAPSARDALSRSLPRVRRHLSREPQRREAERRLAPLNPE